MSQYIRKAAALVVLAVFVACSGGQDDNALLDDTTLSRDLARVDADSAVQPELQDVPEEKVETPPATPPRKQPAPKTQPKAKTPTPPPPAKDTAVTASGNTIEKGTGVAEAPTSGVIAAGSSLRLDAVDKVCTNTNKIGDRFTATVNQAVTGTNGVTIPSGANVTIEVTELKRSENTNDQIVMGFRVINVAFGGKTYPMEGDVQSAVIDRVRASSAGNDAKKVVGGAVAGAIIGQVLGKNRKGTLIGAAAGAAAGGAAAAATANYEGCVNPGADIVVNLTSPLTVATS